MKSEVSPFRDDTAARKTMSTILSPKQFEELYQIFANRDLDLKNTVKIKQSEFSYNFAANFIRICSVVYKASQESPEFASITYDTIENCAKGLVRSNALEIFERLPSELQLNFIREEGVSDTLAAYTYLRTIELMQTTPTDKIENPLPGIIRLAYTTPPNFYTFFNQASESTKNGPRPLDFSIPNAEFMKKMSEYNKLTTTMGSYKETFLVFWRALFGEEPILQLLNSFSAENLYINTDEMLAILEDWEKLKDLPASWIMETVIADRRATEKAKRKW